MTDRRTFLGAVSALGLGVVGRARPGARPSVEARSTIFYGHPDGGTSLLRIIVRDLDAPAGRLRVYDRARRLLGTAGVVRRGDELRGELWLPLEQLTSIVTELEAPGVRGVLRAQHGLTPQPRWTIHWLSVVDPEALRGALDRLPPVSRVVRAALYARGGVRGNPLPPGADLELMDHLAFLRLTADARRLEATHGVPASSAAVVDTFEGLPRTTPIALEGAGVRYLALRDLGPPRVVRWDGPGGAALVGLSTAPGGDATSLAFDGAREEMLRRMEAWLTTTPQLLSPARAAPVALVLGSTPEPTLGAMLANIQAWNGRFAYPRIVVGMDDGLLDQLARSGAASSVEGRSAAPYLWLSPTRLDDARAGRARARTERTSGLVTILARRLAGPYDDLAGVARHLDVGFPGTLVFNPSPFTRTDIACMADGAERMVTDVPPLGYAYVVQAGGPTEPEREPAWREPAGDALELRAGGRRILVDAWTGALTSVRDAMGLEWAAVGRGGLNAVDGARVERVARSTVPGVGERLVAQRTLPGGDRMRSTVTLYDGPSWVDIENESTAPADVAFPFAIAARRVAWDIPAGRDAAEPPVERLVHLRWIALEEGARTALFRSLDAPYVSVPDGSSLVSTAPAGATRYRFRVAETGDPAWRFGWNAEPFVTAPVARGGSGGLPTAGALLEVEQAGVAVLAMKPADLGDGAIVYLQELTGLARTVAVRPGVLTFDGAWRVDFVERDLGPAATDREGGVLVPVPAYGVAAVRLVGVRLRGA